MIASSAAIFALMATLTAGYSLPNPLPGSDLKVLPKPATRDQATAACNALGLRLAAITGANIKAASQLVGKDAFGWVASWEGNNYGGACLQLQSETITVAQTCNDLNLPVCQGLVHPQPPCPSEESSSHFVPIPSCESEDSESCEKSWESKKSESCENSWESTESCPVFSTESECSSYESSTDCESSESFKCYNPEIKDSCESSPSSSGRCDPCCAGVHKLTYQADFPAGEYLAKVSQKFSVFDVFGPNACTNVGSLANNLGVSATIVGSDGTDACQSQISASDSVIDVANATHQVAETSLSAYITSLPSGTVAPSASTTISALLGSVSADISALTSALNSISGLPISAAIQTAVSNTNTALTALSSALNSFTIYFTTTSPLTASAIITEYNSTLNIPNLTNNVNTAVEGIDTAVNNNASIPYGNYYDVYRAWALNSAVYSLLDGTVSAANSLYNCYGEYRAIYITKPLSSLTYVNSRGNACLQQCRGKPQSCLYLCGGLKPPGYQVPFAI